MKNPLFQKPKPLRSWTDLAFPKRLGAADAIYQNYAQLGTDSASSISLH